MTGPIAAILNIKYLLSGIIPSTKRYYDFMAMPEEGETKGEVIPQWNDLSFDKVTFSYLDENPVIDNVSINISKGMKIAIVGRNDCGKSTLMDLLLRLHVPQEGYI